MRVLLVKTSSLGDVVHTLPAITDAASALPGLQLDWVVEEAFADIAAAHPAVGQVLPCALRRWRKSPLATWRSGEWRQFRERVQASDYDCVIDAQGLIKSAFVTRLARGPKAGLDRESAREPLSAWVLDRPLMIPRAQHAIDRVRQLFALALGYDVPHQPPDYGLGGERAARQLGPGARVVFLHGTTWPSKHWPEAYWQELARLALQAGCQVHLPWGNDADYQRALRIREHCPAAVIMPQQSLGELISSLSDMDAFVAVDTGLAHLAAALALPGVALYGPTDPRLTGVRGQRAVNVAAEFVCAPCVQERCTYKGVARDDVRPPCFGALPPERVWQALQAEVRP